MSLPPPTNKQARIIWTAITTFGVAFLLAFLAAVVWGLGWLMNLLSPVLWPLAIGGILAYLLDPVVDFFIRHRVPRAWSIILVFALFVIAIGIFLGSVVPQLVRETGRLIDEVPKYSQRMQSQFNAWVSQQPFLDTWRSKLLGPSTNRTEVTTNAPPAEGTNQVVTVTLPERAWAAKLSEWVLRWASDTLPKIGRWFMAQLSRIASVLGMIISLALVPVFTYYFLAEKHGIVAGWHKYLPITESRFKDELVFVLTNINNYLITFFRGQVVVALCIGVLLTIGFLIIGLHYAVLLGMMAGILNIIPYLGAVLTLVPAITLAAVQFQDWQHPVAVVGVFALVQTLEGFVISPRIMGDRVGLHPLTIIVALMVGTTLLGGILGGILAIPLTAALRVLMFRYVWRPRTQEVTSSP
jgi:predicted PurR-regulated permease PerM